jgi:hypothetical protein
MLQAVYIYVIADCFSQEWEDTAGIAVLQYTEHGISAKKALAYSAFSKISMRWEPTGEDD